MNFSQKNMWTLYCFSFSLHINTKTPCSWSITKPFAAGLSAFEIHNFFHSSIYRLCIHYVCFGFMEAIFHFSFSSFLSIFLFHYVCDLVFQFIQDMRACEIIISNCFRGNLRLTELPKHSVGNKKSVCFFSPDSFQKHEKPAEIKSGIQMRDVKWQLAGYMSCLGMR